jgi:hypothetical protein
MFETAASAITAPPNLKKAISCKSDPAKAIQTYILFFTPRLRVLDLDTTPNCTDTIILQWLLSGTLREDGDYHFSDFVPQGEQQSPNDTVENATPRALYFNELEELRLCTGAGTVDYPMDVFEGALLLPKLKTLSLTNFAWLITKPEEMRRGSVPSLLTRLELHNCLIEPFALGHILARCKNLKHLTIDLHKYSPLPVYGSSLNSFGDVLREFGKHLETLLFSAKAVEEFQGYNTWPTILGCVGSLKELGSLRHLGINRKKLAAQQDRRKMHPRMR